MLRNDSYGPKLSSIKTQHKGQYMKLPAINDDENLTVMSVPKKQLKPMDKHELANLI